MEVVVSKISVFILFGFVFLFNVFNYYCVYYHRALLVGWVLLLLHLDAWLP